MLPPRAMLASLLASSAGAPSALMPEGSELGSDRDWFTSKSGHRRFVLAQPKLVVISVGGIGTTTMMKELAQVDGLEMNDDGDKEVNVYHNGTKGMSGMKHLPFGRLVDYWSDHLLHAERVLYLWGDPLHAVQSLYRRGYQTIQASKTRSEPFSDGTFSHARASVEVPRTLKAFAAAEGEPFQMLEHFQSYLNASTAGRKVGGKVFAPKVAFLRMEKKAEHLDRLAAFLGVEQPALELLNQVVSPWREAEAAELLAERQLARASLLAADAAAQDEAALDAREDALGAIAMERLRGRARRGDAASANLLDRENNPPCSPPGLFCDHDTSPDVVDAINKKFEELRRATEALPGDGFFEVG